MEFINEVKNFANRISHLRENITTEEATKTSTVLPFFQLLGYDVFNPLEFIPEYTADTGTKKGEKVDYAIMRNNNPIMIVEVKAINSDLNTKHINQLFRYFTVTKARFGVLTNGIIYKFYSDLEEPNKMDLNPFLEINLLDIKEESIAELSKFKKDNFDMKGILNSASELKYTALMKNAISEQFKNPSDQFVKSLLTKEIYNGVKTQAVVDKFREIAVVAINEYINDLINDKIKNAISTQTFSSEPGSSEIKDYDFLPEELETLDYVRDMLNISKNDVVYKKTSRYAYMHIPGSTNKWICRVTVKTNNKLFTLHKFEKHNFETKYYYDEVELLDQIEDIIYKVYTECTLM